MKKSVFSVKEYRAFLRAQATGSEARGIVTKMAEAAECQQSHISRVMKDQLHLTTEQAFRLSRFFKLHGSEQRYFMKMVEHERSGDVEHRASVKQELESLRRAQEDLAERMQEPTLSVGEHELLYYSSWHWSAIHVAVSIPELQTASRISERLGLPRAQVQACLQQLQQLGLVKSNRAVGAASLGRTPTEERWSFVGSHGFHLSRKSPLNAIQHSNWRARAVMASQSPVDDGVHYTVVQSLSRTDFEKVKEVLLRTIDEYAAIARPSKEEELVCFLCDFFRV